MFTITLNEGEQALITFEEVSSELHIDLTEAD